MSEFYYSVPTGWQGWVWQGGDSPQDLRNCFLPAEPLQPGDVLVQNAAIGLNPVDWKTLDIKRGKVPGTDGAGTVVATGTAVDTRWMGRRVAYHQSLHRNGSFAEYTLLAAQTLIAIPDEIDFATAAAIPCPALTAWQAIEKVPAQAGARLLIAGAGGAVGHFLVQLAYAREFDVTTVSHPRHWSRLKALGASRCLDTPLHVSASHHEPFFAVIDAVNPQHAAELSELLLANGHLVCIQGRVGNWPCPPFERALSLHEVALGALHLHGDARQWKTLTQQGEKLLSQMAKGVLQSETVLKFFYNQIPSQLLALQHRNFSGKQIIVI